MRIPELVPELSHERVLTTEWIDGMSWDAVRRRRASQETKQRVGEVIWRFGQHSIHAPRCVQRRPAPRQLPLPPRRQRDVPRLRARQALGRPASGSASSRASTPSSCTATRSGSSRRWRTSGFLAAGHGLDPDKVFDYVSSPYRPYLVDEFTFTRDWMRETLARIFDINGPHAEVIAKLNMPPSFVILDRVVWGVSAILGKLNVRDRGGRCCSSTAPTARRRPSSAPCPNCHTKYVLVDIVVSVKSDTPSSILGSQVSKSCFTAA